MINYVFTPRQEEIMLSACKKFGSENRVKKAMEEFCELYVATKDNEMKYVDNQNPKLKAEITTEVADCIIMGWQLENLSDYVDASHVFLFFDFIKPYIAMYYGLYPGMVGAEIDYKLLRLERLLNQ